ARLAMAAHAAEGEQDPARERPRRAAAALEHELNPLQHLIHERLREQGWSYGEGARRGGVPRFPPYTPPTTPDPTPPPPPAPGHDRRARQRPRRASLRRSGRRRRVHRVALLRRGPSRARAPKRPGKRTPNRQHRRAVARRPASRGRARRVAAPEGFAGAGGG